MPTYIRHCDAAELENRNAYLDTVIKTLTRLDNNRMTTLTKPVPGEITVVMPDLPTGVLVLPYRIQRRTSTVPLTTPAEVSMTIGQLLPAGRPAAAQRRRAGRWYRRVAGSVVTPVDPLDPALLDRAEVRAALVARDVGAVYRLLWQAGVSQRRIAQLTHQSQSEVSAILAGRQVRDVWVLERIADGLGVPRAWMRLGYGEDEPGALSAEEEVDEDVKRRALITTATGVALGQVVQGLGEFAEGGPADRPAAALAAGHGARAHRGGSHRSAARCGAVLRRAG